MTAILETLVSITLGSLLTAGVIILIRILFRNILSAKAKYYLWLLLALRLCLPVLPESPTSLMNLFPGQDETPQLRLVETTAAQAPPGEVNFEPVYTATEPFSEPALKIVVDTQTNEETGTQVVTSYAISWDDLAVILWGIGAVITLIVFGILYLITARNLHHLPHCAEPDTLRVFLDLRKNLGIRREIRLVSGSGGMSGGLFRPTIVIPAEQHGEALKPILLHELMHIRAKDLWLMAFYRLLCALNWFNPLVWLCFHRANLDSEAACDQRVLETGLVEKASYAEVLYRESLLDSRNGLYFRTAFGGGKHAIRDRIRQITRFAGKQKWMVPLVLVLVIVVSACTLTDRADTTAPTITDSTDATAPPLTITDSAETGNNEFSLNEYGQKIGPISQSSTEESTHQTTSASLFSPVEKLGDTLSLKTCQWGMTPEEVISALGFNAEQYRMTNNGQNYHLEVEAPLDDHPEVMDIDFTFHYIDLDLTLGLDTVEISYDKAISYEELVTCRTNQLGEATSASDSAATWEGYPDVTLTVNDGNKLWERITYTNRGALEDLLMDFNMENYMASLHPPGGHFGWTYQEHLSNGLLPIEDGVYTDHGDGTQSYVTTIDLGGYKLTATYWFTSSVLTYDKGIAPVLREVHVDVPEGIGLSKWIANFSDSFTNRLYQNDTYSYKAPLSLGTFLTEAQKESIAQAFNKTTDSSGSTESWPLATYWYDSSAHLWKYNATGYTLYLDALNLIE